MGAVIAGLAFHACLLESFRIISRGTLPNGILRGGRTERGEVARRVPLFVVYMIF